MRPGLGAQKNGSLEKAAVDVLMFSGGYIAASFASWSLSFSSVAV